MEYGILGQEAPELDGTIEWIGPDGSDIEPIRLSDFPETFKVIYGFQSWCPGCHSRGLPALQEMVDALKANPKVVFFGVQTVFEGFEANTKDKLAQTQSKYGLKIPFGHDVGTEDTGNRSSIMYNYRTGGTPWFIFVDQKDKVVFNDFHLNTEAAIDVLKQVE